MSIARASLWMLVDRSARLANGLLVTAFVARILGPEQYGLLTLATAFAAVFIAAAGMGADHFHIAVLARDPARRNVFVANAMASRLSWSACCLVLAVIAIALSQRADLAAVKGILVLGVPLIALTLFNSALVAEGAFAEASFASLISVVGSAILKFVVLSQGGGALAIAWCVVAESLMNVTLAGGILLKRPDFRLSLSLLESGHIKGYLRACLPLAISAALIAIYLRVEFFIVGAVLGDASAGLWAATMMFISPWTLLSSAFLPVVNREISRRNPMDAPDSDRNSVVRLLRIAALLAVVAVPVNVVAATILIKYLFGPRYDSVLSLVPIVSLTVLPLFFGGVQEIWIAQRATTRVVLKKAIVGIPMSAATVWAGCHWGGLQGAAIAMVVSYFVTAIGLNAVFDRSFFYLQIRSFGLAR